MRRWIIKDIIQQRYWNENLSDFRQYLYVTKYYTRNDAEIVAKNIVKSHNNIAITILEIFI